MRCSYKMILKISLIGYLTVLLNSCGRDTRCDHLCGRTARCEQACEEIIQCNQIAERNSEQEAKLYTEREVLIAQNQQALTELLQNMRLDAVETIAFSPDTILLKTREETSFRQVEHGDGEIGELYAIKLRSPVSKGSDFKAPSEDALFWLVKETIGVEPTSDRPPIEEIGDEIAIPHLISDQNGNYYYPKIKMSFSIVATLETCYVDSFVAFPGYDAPAMHFIPYREGSSLAGEKELHLPVKVHQIKRKVVGLPINP